MVFEKLRRRPEVGLWVGLLACGLALTACAGGSVQQAATEPPPPPPKRNLKPADAMAEARKEVATKLKDPESARFTDVRYLTTPNARGEPTDVVCGKVNAKNSYGGYAGASGFVYMVDYRSVSLVGGKPIGGMDVDLIVYRNFCEGGFAGRTAGARNE